MSGAGRLIEILPSLLTIYVDANNTKAALQISLSKPTNRYQKMYQLKYSQL